MELLCYTRNPKDEMVYSGSMAGSMHMAWRDGSGKFLPFHHNEGILYAKAVQNPVDGTLTKKSLASPWIFVIENGEYGIAAIRTEADGSPDTDSEGSILLFRTCDFVHYEELGLYQLQETGQIRKIQCKYLPEQDVYHFCWLSEDGLWRCSEVLLEKADGKKRKNFCIQIVPGPMFDQQVFQKDDFTEIEGIRSYHSIMISEKMGEYLKNKLGNHHFKQSDRRREHVFPAIQDKADPHCMYWKGMYYFVATNEADENRTITVRCADNMWSLLDADEKILLDTKTFPNIKNLLWAPEFHEIEGVLYIFFAATRGEFYMEKAFVMKLKKEGNPLCRTDWLTPQPVLKKDGSLLCKEGEVISLDMTVFRNKEKYYALWSQRQFIPVDQGAWLYIAELDAKQPWKLACDPVCLAIPEYGWENNHAFVVEGPYALWHEGKLIITYSGSAVDATYTVGILIHESEKSVLDPASWTKGNYPLMSSRSAEGEYGTGHNSYVEDKEGTIWNFYHARKFLDDSRSCGIRKVFFDIDGEPILDAVVNTN